MRRGIGRVENRGRGDGGVGAKNDENATSNARARQMEEPSPRPESARARKTSIKVCRVIDNSRLSHDCTIEVVLTKPGD